MTAIPPLRESGLDGSAGASSRASWGRVGRGKPPCFAVCWGRSTPITATSACIPSRDVARCGLGYVPQVETVDWNFPISVEQVVALGRWREQGLAALDAGARPSPGAGDAGPAGDRRAGAAAHPRALRRATAARVSGAGTNRRSGPAASGRAHEWRGYQDAPRDPAPPDRSQPRRCDHPAHHARSQRGGHAPAPADLFAWRGRWWRTGHRWRCSTPDVLLEAYGAEMVVIRRGGHVYVVEHYDEDTLPSAVVQPSGREHAPAYEPCTGVPHE